MVFGDALASNEMVGMARVRLMPVVAIASTAGDDDGPVVVCRGRKTQRQRGAKHSSPHAVLDSRKEI